MIENSELILTFAKDPFQPKFGYYLVDRDRPLHVVY